MSVSTRLAAYQKRFKALKNPTADSDWKRFEQSLVLPRCYGERYQFDYLMVTAQGIPGIGAQPERQRARSAPSASCRSCRQPAELGVGDIHQAEANVHGGIKYMRKLIDTYFDDADFDETNRTLFAFARPTTPAPAASPSCARKPRRKDWIPTSGSTTSN